MIAKVNQHPAISFKDLGFLLWGIFENLGTCSSDRIGPPSYYSFNNRSEKGLMGIYDEFCSIVSTQHESTRCALIALQIATNDKHWKDEYSRGVMSLFRVISDAVMDNELLL